jgi:hypothetical protein
VRFIIAIVTFVVAAALIGLGLAQRTLFAPASHITATAHVTGQPRYILIPGTVLDAHPGRQTLKLDADNGFLAYGRTSDVTAWLAGQAYARVGLNAEGMLVTSPVTAQKSASEGSPGGMGATAAAEGDSLTTGQPDPAGSDLWLEAYKGEAAREVQVGVPRNASVLVATDGSHPAPRTITLSWPADTSTPWTGPLVTGGILLLLAGVVVYGLGLRHLRRSRGPRRRKGAGGGKMPRLPRPVRVKQPHAGGGRALSGRRHLAVAVGLAVVPALLAGCSPQYWPTGASTPVPTPSPLSTGQARTGKSALPPAVTEDQLHMIVRRVSEQAAKADAEGDSSELGKRFTAAALQMRSTNYTIRRTEAKNKVDAGKRLAPFAQIPAGPIAVALPMATDTWPRVVDAIVQNAEDKKQAPLMLVLVQNTPRDNYQVNYAIPLQPDTRVPDVASAKVGTSIVPPTSKLLGLAPDQVAAAYGDLMDKGEKSAYWNLFDMQHDTLYEELGPDYKKKKQSAVSKTATLTYSYALGKAPTVALATLDSGALVATYLTETVTIRAVQSGAEVSVGDQAAALVGKKTSSSGASTTYGYQLLFYVPPTGSKKKITLLGFSQGMISATEVKKK